jgi:hypothetical protein
VGLLLYVSPENHLVPEFKHIDQMPRCISSLDVVDGGLSSEA